MRYSGFVLMSMLIILVYPFIAQAEDCTPPQLEIVVDGCGLSWASFSGEVCGSSSTQGCRQKWHKGPDIEVFLGDTTYSVSLNPGGVSVTCTKGEELTYEKSGYPVDGGWCYVVTFSLPE